MMAEDLHAQLVELLISCGHTPQEAEHLARETARHLRSAAVGTTYGHLWPDDLPRVWAAAERHGRQRLVLEIVAEGQEQDEYDGHVTARVVEAEDWPDWNEAKRVYAAYAQALAARSADVDPLTLAHRLATADLEPAPDEGLPRPAASPETALQEAHHLVAEAMTLAARPDQRELLARARKLLLDLQARTLN